MTNPLIFSGFLKEKDLIQVLETLLANKATGTLTLQNQGQVKSISLKEGMIVFASSNLPEDRLGEMLLKSQKITPEQYRISVEIIKKTGKRHGSVLVEEGFLNPKEIFEGLKFQVKEIFTSLFLWEEGEFTFLDGELSRQVIPLQLKLEDLISEAIERVRQEIHEPS
ncbi:MAG TPA: DUF4388 domain-containing protein [Nitrospiria bacterium]|jgi:hypothetical protein